MDKCTSHQRAVSTKEQAAHTRASLSICVVTAFQYANSLDCIIGKIPDDVRSGDHSGHRRGGASHPALEAGVSYFLQPCTGVQ
ncbi:hypothetical protein TNCV_3222751 [Trichonephila clavipes]|nr:hypothetical protein TNCV_3222751 [Trichonephila clavipes]